MKMKSVFLTAASTLAVGYLFKQWADRAAYKAKYKEDPKKQAEVDSEINDSFPASDPPSWTH